MHPDRWCLGEKANIRRNRMPSPPTIALRYPVVRDDVCHSHSFEQNMAVSIPVSRMSSIPHESHHLRSYHHHPSYSSKQSPVDRGTPSHSNAHRSHPYRRMTSPSSQRRTSSNERRPRLTLPPPNTSGSFNFPSESLPSSREREYPRPPPTDHMWDLPSTGGRRPLSSSGGTERGPTPSPRPASGGKSCALPPLRSISDSNTSGTSPTSMAPPSRDFPPSGRESPHHRVPPLPYYDYEYHQQMYYPHDHHRPQTATPSRYREHERYKKDMHDYRGPPASFTPRSHYPPAYQQAYDAPSSPLQTVEQLYPMAAHYPHTYGGPHELGRSMSQSSLPGVSRPSTGEEETSTGEVVSQGQSRRLAHLMSEQKRRE